MTIDPEKHRVYLPRDRNPIALNRSALGNNSLFDNFCDNDMLSINRLVTNFTDKKDI